MAAFEGQFSDVFRDVFAPDGLNDISSEVEVRLSHLGMAIILDGLNVGEVQGLNLVVLYRFVVC